MVVSIVGMKVGNCLGVADFSDSCDSCYPLENSGAKRSGTEVYLTAGSQLVPHQESGLQWQQIMSMKVPFARPSCNGSEAMQW